MARAKCGNGEGELTTGDGRSSDFRPVRGIEATGGADRSSSSEKSVKAGAMRR